MQEEQQQPTSFRFNAFQQWEISFVYAFSCIFNAQQQEISPSFYKLPDFTPQELEDEIQKEESDLVHKIICAALGNTLNRKHPIESFKVSLQQLVTEKIKSFEIDLEVNPLTKQSFNTLAPDVKLYMLHSLIEWQLHDSQSVRSIIEYHNSNTRKNQYNPIRSYPIGIDSKKRSYWQFGESCWIWRERLHLKKGCGWETVCKNRQDLEKLVQELSASTNRSEKALMKVITEDIYELADKEEREKIRKEKAEMRKLIPIEISITPTTLRSRGRTERVRYNYDDYDDTLLDEDDGEFEDESEEEEASKRTSNKRDTSTTNRPTPTRWSSRIHGIDDGRWSDPSIVDNMVVDTPQPLDNDSMDTSPIQSQMDTESPNLSVMDTTPSETAMNTSRSQSLASSAMEN